MTTATMDDLRQQLQTTEQAETLRKEKLFIQLAKKLADNQPVSAEELKSAGIVSLRSANLICPSCGSDTCRVVRTMGTNQSCVCDGCGHSWKQPVPDELPEGCRPFGELEAAVQQIHKRREWKAQLAKLPEQQSRLKAIQQQQNGLVAAVESAIIARDQFAKQHEGELFTLQRATADGEAITQEVIRSCDNPELIAEKRELDRQRGIVTQSLEALTTDLWGYSRPGLLDSVVRESTGSELLVRLQQLVSTTGLSDLAREKYPEHFAAIPITERKNPKQFGEWLSPDSEAFKSVVRAERPASELRAELKAYGQFYASRIKPMVEEWIQLHFSLKDIEAQFPQLLQRMLND